MTLIMSQPRPPSIQDISRAIAAARTFDEQDAAYRAYDRTERALAGEYESGRAFRLLLKLGFINERPELGPNRRWTQSGDCYVLTLFRDYGTRHCVTLLCLLRSCRPVPIASTHRAIFRISLSSGRRCRLSGHGFGACGDRAEQT
jgi:Pan3 Pseudokinase domain